MNMNMSLQKVNSALRFGVVVGFAAILVVSRALAIPVPEPEPSYDGHDTVDGITWAYRVYGVPFPGDDAEFMGPYTPLGGDEQILTGDIRIPSSLDRLKMRWIWKDALKGQDYITSVTIPVGIREIFDSAFSYCDALTRVVISSTVTNIEGNVFSCCPNLMSIEVDADNKAYKSVDGMMLTKDGRTLISGINGDVTIPSGVTVVGAGAFASCERLTRVTIPSSVRDIDSGAFAGCIRLPSVTIPSGVTNISNAAFSRCEALSSVMILPGVTEIGAHAFSACHGLRSISIPSSVMEVDRFAFSSTESVDDATLPGWDCYLDLSSLTSLTISEGTTNIRYAAFAHCTELKSVTIPEGVETISEGAFFGCSGLTSVRIPASVRSIGADAFACCPALVKFEVAEGNQHYKAVDGMLLNRDGWRLVAGVSRDVTIPSGVFAIGTNAFWGCTGLTEVTIPPSVRGIEAGAFQECTGLTEVTLPSSVTEIGASAFDGCTKLREVELSPNLTALPDYLFRDCRSLKFLVVPAAVTRLGRGICAHAAFDFGALYGPEGLSEFNVYYLGNAPAFDENVYEDADASLVSYVRQGATGWDKVVIQDDEWGYYYSWPTNNSRPIRFGWEPEDPTPVGPDPVDPMVVDVPVVEPTGAFEAAKARTDNGVLVKDGAAFGVLQLKIGKASRKGESKVSVTVIGLDGKKYTAKAVKVPTGEMSTQTFEVKKLGMLTLTFGANGFSGSLNGAIATSVEGTAATMDGMATFAATDLSSLMGVLSDYLPAGEAVTRTEKKWKVVAKAGKLKYNKKANPKRGIVEGLQATGDNIAGLKLTYTPKTQTFKGSFKVWTFDEAKKRLKSVSAKVTGVVVNGAGYGEVVAKKAKIGELTVK